MDEPFGQPFTIQYKNLHTKIDILKVASRRILTHWNDAVLTRPYWRLFWVNRTGARFHHKDTTFELSPNCLNIIPPYLEVVHEFISTFDIFNINVDIEKPFHTYPDILQVPIDTEHLRIIHKIVKDPFAQGFQREAELQTLVLKVLMSLDKSYYESSQVPNKISEVIKYMEGHIDEYLSNEVLADMCGMSKNSFIRLFSKETNISPQEYLRNIRLDASANFLVKTKLSIDEITKRCGFSERNYFSRVFSKRFKMGPVSYRKVEA